MGYADPLNWIVRRPIAHRGLHDAAGGVPENSLPAAHAAISNGYTIECDVQLSADRTAYVFHDDTLARLVGDPRLFRDVVDDELSTMRLLGTAAGIPTVEALLGTIAGRVPIVMELKGTSPDQDIGFVDRLAEVLDGYRGDLALMSFDEWLVEAMIAASLPYPIGLTAEGREASELARHRRLFERGCDFVSYKLDDLPNAFCEWVRRERQAPVLSWTVRSQADAERSAVHADQVTFEGFAPQP